MVLFAYLVSKESSFIIINVLVVLVNKYVLSVLKFTIPTVFQGWQTMICVIILSVLARWKKLRAEVEVYDKKTTLSLFLPLSFFTLAIVSGSKALAELPVPVFLAGGNLTPAILALLDRSQSHPGAQKLIALFTILNSVAVLFLLSLSSSAVSAWLWLIVYNAAVIIQTVSQRYLNINRLNAVTLIYYRNFYSVLLLVPLSVYLEEAADAFHYHTRLASINFYSGCILSGVLGTWLQFLSSHIETSKNFPLYLGCSKIVCAVSSCYFFSFQMEFLAWLMVIVNLLAGMFGFTYETSSMTDNEQEKTVVHI